MSEDKTIQEQVHEAPQILEEGGINSNNQMVGMSEDPLLGNTLSNENDALVNDNQTFDNPSEPVANGMQGNEQFQEGQQAEDSAPTNWEASSKYFQSEKDKSNEHNKQLNQDLKKYKALGEFVDGRPDVQEYLNGMLTDGQSTNSHAEGSQAPEGEVKPPSMAKPPEDFDPWDAYNEPQSSSYQFRVNQEQNNVNTALGKFKNEIVGQYEQEKRVTAFDKELGHLGLDDVQKKNFYEFANTPVAQMGTEQLVAMWRATGDTVPSTQPDPSIAATRRTQNSPTAGTGILQGEAPRVDKTDSDSMWDGIMTAADKNNIF